MPFRLFFAGYPFLLKIMILSNVLIIIQALSIRKFDKHASNPPKVTHKIIETY